MNHETFTTLKFLQSSNLQFPHWTTSVQISSFIPHFLELCICYKTLCEILNFAIISSCTQLGSVTLVTTGVSGTTGFLGAMGSCPILTFPLCSCPDFPYNWLFHHLLQHPVSVCISVCGHFWCIWQRVSCTPLLGLWWMADIPITNFLSNCYSNSFLNASLHHLHSHTN